MSENIAMRDALINRIYDLAKQDRDVIFISADMGAQALDRYRKNLADQFVNVGIAEQNMIAIAAGLALEGKKVYTFSIAPFTTSRCHEFIKLNCGLMKIPINIIGVGTGFSYSDSGPTHHTTEDISIIRALPNIEILCPSDSKMAGNFADLVYKSKNPTYVRLDRAILPNISDKYYKNDSLEKGFKELEEGNSICIISTGNMVHKALEISEEMMNSGKKVGVIDLYRLKPIDGKLKDVLLKYKYIISLEEHIINGGLGSIISEIITDNNLSVKLKRIGLKDYIYAYGSREDIHKRCGIDVDFVIDVIENL